MGIYGQALRRHLGRTTAGVAVAVVTSFLAAVVLLFVGTDSWTPITEVIALFVIAGGTMAAMAADVREDSPGRLFDWSFGSYLVSTSTGMLAIGFAYLRFYCDQATAVITGFIDKNQDVWHWKAQVISPSTGQQVVFDTYSRDGDGVTIGHELEVIVDPRGWIEPSKPDAGDMFYPMLGVTLALFVLLFLISALRARGANGSAPALGPATSDSSRSPA